MKRTRDITFDIMKGIAILAMIAGHCFIPFQLHHFIYIWHMPLFFVVSGYFFHEKPVKLLLHDIFRGLIVPYVVTALAILLCVFVSDTLMGTVLWQEVGVGLFAINGLLDNPDRYGGLYKSGPIWFLLALSWCRVVYNILIHYKINMVLLTILLGMVSYGISAHSSLLYLPFFMLQGFASLVFYHIGYFIKINRHCIQNKKTLFLLLISPAPIVGMCQNGLDIWGLWFSNWIMNVYAATGTVLLLYVIVKNISRFSAPPSVQWHIVRYMGHIGQYSILLLALHSLEKALDISGLIMNTQHIVFPDGIMARFMKIILQFAFCLFGLYLIERIRVIRKLYNLH